ncbi:P-loop containing nucleoside triphosphate hydrolase protein [Exidia glandulosa HHB12029]|uniref:p-loop containing nucleoside triphosphate hydrolase protein n=1 Tax=Exidia glandulosa HHB12029 TaxID=1314781 RepID=A0A165K2M0_EXIGL|nr:P-loop containing nucleoside triphosphate hydrolase protein [Exidia glandulosa HHB12029]
MGKLVSLVSVDVNKIASVASILETFAATPLTIVITAWFLYSLIGYSGFVGYIFFFASFPWSWSINKRMMSMQTAVMQKRDLRMRSVNELLQSIKFVKFSAWETRWIERVLRFREEELSQLVKLRVLYALFGLTWHLVPIIISCVDLAWFTGFAGGQLTVAIAFPTIHALAVLTAELNEVPSLFGWYGSIVTAFRRIDEFLGEEEVPDSVSSLKRGDEVSTLQFDARLGATGASFEWYSTSAKQIVTNAKPVGPVATSAPRWKVSPLRLFKKPAPTQGDATPAEVVEQVSTFQLHDINVVFPRGQLSVVTGATGSGKSSLLSAILGEMRRLQGRVLLPRFPFHVDPATGLSENVSYCAQRPWLESKTVRENIVFGSPFDNDRYAAVLDACALVQDFNQWDDGGYPGRSISSLMV